VTNTLAYYGTELMTVVKSFKGHAHDEYFFYFDAILSRFFKAQTKGLYGLEALHHLMEQCAFKKCKQLFECQHLLLLRDIWQSTF
jgi:hypothetical protein